MAISSSAYFKFLKGKYKKKEPRRAPQAVEKVSTAIILNI